MACSCRVPVMVPTCERYSSPSLSPPLSLSSSPSRALSFYPLSCAIGQLFPCQGQPFGQQILVHIAVSGSGYNWDAACRAPTAGELLQCIARSRGWVVGNGLPDEARSGRLLLKDYTAGKLAYCEWPPSPSVAHPGDDSSPLQADPDTAASSSGPL